MRMSYRNEPLPERALCPERVLRDDEVLHRSAADEEHGKEKPTEHLTDPLHTYLPLNRVNEETIFA